jgi:DNA-binding CsgD family transcriptional regulator
MLRLTMQGFSLDQIGRLMFKSVETIKFYRRQVFSKLGVKNISEAIAYATQYGMI